MATHDVEVRLVVAPDPRADRAALRAAVTAVAATEIGPLTRLCPHCAGTGHGRPRAPGVHVSLSYAPGLAVLAWSASTPLGVDVEAADAGADVAAWTRTEAVLKLTGEGVRRDPATVRPDEAVIVPLDSLVDLPDGYVGAVAVRHR